MRKSATNSVNHYSRSFSVFRMHSAFGMALGMVYLIFSTKKNFQESEFCAAPQMFRFHLIAVVILLQLMRLS